MIEQVPDNEPIINPFRLISDALSTRNDGRSVAATELNKQVEICFNEDTPIKTLYRIGVDNVVGRDFNVKYLNNAITSNDQDKFSVALISPVSEFVAVRKRKILLSHIVYHEVNDENTAPKLVAILSDTDEYIPLATFNLDKGYVQIGDEINKESLFTTSTDEFTPRLGIIEKIRSIVDGRTDNNLKCLAVLLDHELSNLSYEDPVLKAKEATLVRHIFEFAEVQKNMTMFVLNDETGSFDKENINFGHLLKVPRSLSLEDGRNVNLVFGDRGDKNQLHLLALTRDNIALPLLMFDKLTGEMTMSNSLSHIEKQDIFNNLTQLMCLSNEQAIKIYAYVDEVCYPAEFCVKLPDTISHYYNALSLRSSRTIEFIAGAKYLEQLGLIEFIWSNKNPKSQYIIEKIFRKKSSPKVVNSIYTELDSVLDNIDDYNKKSNNLLFQLIGYYRNNTQKSLIDSCTQLCQNLGVAKKFDSIIGPTTETEEIITHKLLKMLAKGSNYSTYIKNIVINNTEIGAKVSLSLENIQDTFYSLVINTSTVAIADEDSIEIIRLNFDTKLPLFKLMRYSKESSQDKAHDILEILNLFNVQIGSRMSYGEYYKLNVQ